jgi:hypothetical protein
MRIVGNRLGWGAGALAAILSGHAAFAQDVSAAPEPDSNFDRDRTVAITDRVVKGFEEKGYVAGGFMILPRIEFAGIADDNILARTSDRKGDFGVSVAPSVEARSMWSRNLLVVTGSGVLTRLASLKTENSETFDLRARARFDATDRLSVTGLAGYRRNTERRSDPGALRNSARPVTYVTVSMGGRMAWQGSRLRLLAEGETAKITYEDVTTADGTVIDSSALDRRQTRGAARADYAITPNLAVIALATVTKIDYNRASGVLGIDRTSRKAEFLTGVSFEFTDLLRGEVALGYVSQNYRRAPIPNFSGLGGRIRLEYYPTRLTGVRLDASRAIREAGNPLAPSYVRTRAALTVDHELYRRLVVSASADYERNRYRLPSRTEQRWHAGLSARYLVSRHVTLFTRFDHLRVSSRPADIGRRFTENAFSAGILLRP